MANLHFLTGGDVAPVRKNGSGMFGEVASRLLPRHDPLWQEIFDDLQAQCRNFGTELVAREDVVEVRPRGS